MPIEVAENEADVLYEHFSKTICSMPTFTTTHSRPLVEGHGGVGPATVPAGKPRDPQAARDAGIRGSEPIRHDINQAATISTGRHDVAVVDHDASNDSQAEGRGSAAQAALSVQKPP